MCPFFIEMSEFVYFSCPGVRIWGFSLFSKTFQKTEKIEVFTHHGPGELFWLNSLMCPFSIQMSEFVYFSCPGVRIWGFSSFSKFFKKSKNLKFSPTTHLGNFSDSIYSCAHFPFKWVNLYIFLLSWSENMRIFFIFINFSKNWINCFRPPRTWCTVLAQFTHVPIFHPNKWIGTF